MNRFVSRKSVLALAVIWVSVFSLFADGANITDLFSDFTTIHFDECNDPGVTDQLLAAVDIPAPSLNSLGERHTDSYSTPKTIAPKREILDQDSPSLAAIPTLSTDAVRIFLQEEHLVHHRVFFHSSLYLDHCTLLL